MQAIVIDFLRWFGLCPWICSPSACPTNSGNLKTELNIKTGLSFSLLMIIGLCPCIYVSCVRASSWLGKDDTGFTVIATYLRVMNSVFSILIMNISLLAYSCDMAKFFYHICIQSEVFNIKVSLSLKEKLLGMFALSTAMMSYILFSLELWISFSWFWFITFLSFLLRLITHVLVPFSFFVFCKFLDQNLKSTCERLLLAIGTSSQILDSKNDNQFNRDTSKAAENLKANILWNEYMKELMMKCYTASLAQIYCSAFINFVNCLYFSIHKYLSSLPPNYILVLVILSEVSLLCLVNFPADDYNDAVSRFC